MCGNVDSVYRGLLASCAAYHNLSTLYWRSLRNLQYRTMSKGCVSALHRTTLWRLKTWLLLLVFGAVSKQTNIPELFEVKDHVTQCSGVAHWWVFNSFWTTTTEVCGTEEWDISGFRYTHGLALCMRFVNSKKNIENRQLCLLRDGG